MPSRLRNVFAEAPPVGSAEEARCEHCVAPIDTQNLVNPTPCYVDFSAGWGKDSRIYFVEVACRNCGRKTGLGKSFIAESMWVAVVATHGGQFAYRGEIRR